MQIAGKLSKEDVDDARKLLRSKYFWPKVLFRNAYSVILVGGILGVTVAGLVGSTHPNWRALGIAWLSLLGLGGWVAFRLRRARQRQFTRLSETLPDWIDVSDRGVQMDGPNGANSFHPWANFKGWREGKRVIVVDRAQSGEPVVLPVGDLSDGAREPVRQLLRSHISPLKAK